MSGPLDDFLKQVVSDCVNGSSGEWSSPAKTLSAYYLMAYDRRHRPAAEDVK